MGGPVATAQQPRGPHHTGLGLKQCPRPKASVALLPVASPEQGQASGRHRPSRIESGEAGWAQARPTQTDPGGEWLAGPTSGLLTRNHSPVSGASSPRSP